MPRKADPEAVGMDEYGLPAVIHTELLCYLTGVTPRRLHQLITDNRIPQECNLSGDKWRATQSLREIFGYYRRAADHAKPTTERQLDLQMMIEDLRAKRLKSAKMSKDLLPWWIYKEIWGELISSWKNRFLAFPDKMAQRVFRAKDKVEVAEILNKEIREIFAGLNDPKAMEEIVAKIRDDEFESGADTNSSSGDRAEAAENLEPRHT